MFTKNQTTKQADSGVTALQLRDSAKYQLEQIKDIESGIDYLNKVKAIETWARAEKKDAELQNLIAEQKLRTQRILGSLIREGQERGEIASQQSFSGNRFVEHSQEEYSTPRTLSEVGLTPKQSHIFQKIADIPEPDFESFIAEKKEAVNRATSELTTSGAIKLAEQLKNKPHVSHNSGDNEWYTPQEYIESARQVMGVIDLDPASSDTANEIIKAKDFFSIDDNGLNHLWNGNVWMNPPYAQPLISQFSEKLYNEIENGNINQAIVLVNNATETMWFQIMLQSCSAVCFPKGRIKFWAPDKSTAAPLQGQAFLYFGKNIKSFETEFKKYGKVLHV